MRLYIQGPAGNQGIGIFSIVRDGTGNVFAEVSIVGFLEDVP
jgi:hypothetical protein